MAVVVDVDGGVASVTVDVDASSELAGGSVERARPSTLITTTAATIGAANKRRRRRGAAVTGVRSCERWSSWSSMDAICTVALVAAASAHPIPVARPRVKGAVADVG